MKKVSLLIFILSILSCVDAQQLGQVKFTGAADLNTFAFVTEQGVLIRISPEGKVLEWGTELQSLRYSNYYAPALQPFMGRIDYYGAEADSINRGKVKSIGTCWLTYYGNEETDEKAGKLKKIGRNTVDYYSRFENEAFRGKIRLLGDQLLTYYPSYEDALLKGKLKSIGSTQISYYSTFDDKFLKGKIKSIGPVTIQYYSYTDRQESRGMLKQTSERQVINGVLYILR